MAVRTQPQLAMDEQTINDPVIEAALDARQKAKNSLDAVRLKYNEAHELAIGEIAKLELPDGGAVRVGPFRVTRTYVPARTVQPFDTKASSRLRITLADDD